MTAAREFGGSRDFAALWRASTCAWRSLMRDELPLLKGPDCERKKDEWAALTQGTWLWEGKSRDQTSCLCKTGLIGDERLRSYLWGPCKEISSKLKLWANWISVDSWRPTIDTALDDQPLTQLLIAISCKMLLVNYQKRLSTMGRWTVYIGLGDADSRDTVNTQNILDWQVRTHSMSNQTGVIHSNIILIYNTRAHSVWPSTLAILAPSDIWQASVWAFRILCIFLLSCTQAGTEPWSLHALYAVHTARREAPTHN
jgi:hypothetical protein